MATHASDELPASRLPCKAREASTAWQVRGNDRGPGLAAVVRAALNWPRRQALPSMQTGSSTRTRTGPGPRRALPVTQGRHGRWDFTVE